MQVLKNVVKKSLFILNNNPLSRFSYQQEIEKRSKLPLTNIQMLAKHINLFSPYTSESYQPNDWYGHAHILKMFLGLSQSYQFKFVIEHGVVLSNVVNTHDISTSFSTLITQSAFRAKIMEKYKKRTFSIGPYLHYSPYYFSKSDLLKKRGKLGKTLLVFPSHSTLDLQAVYDNRQFIQLIKRIGKNFSKIRICLYWKDILRGMDRDYQEAGFECVTAGHILDPNFLPRLKSMIYLSDYTLSNDAGTHVGYCILLNKPHLIIKQQHRFKGSKTQFNLAQNIYKSKPYQEILNEFSRKTNKITPKQKYLINKYWGTSNIKTKSQLKKIVKETERIYQKDE